MGLTQQELADGIYVPFQRVNEIVSSRRGITPRTVLLLARLLSMSAGFWMNLQLRWDLYPVQKSEAQTLDTIEPFRLTNELVGYCCFGEDGQVPGGDYRGDALDVGAGLRPDHTGRGVGSSFLTAILAFGEQEFAPAAFRATVAAFNQRALRACAKVGFRPVQEFTSIHTGKPFVILLLNVVQE